MCARWMGASGLEGRLALEGFENVVGGSLFVMMLDKDIGSFRTGV